MNIISMAISIFISNYIIMVIIRLLPIRNKRIWQLAIISLFCLGEIGGYLWIAIQSIGVLDLLSILSILGSVFGVLIGYIASLMMVLDGVTLFKSRRLKEFERNLNNKEGRSVPRHILGVIACSFGIALIVYGVVTVLHYDSRLLATIIGTFIGGAIFIAVALYFFISGAPKHKTLKASNLLFIVDFEGEKLVYQANLTKEFTLEQALGDIMETYILDEYGLIITPTEHYVVKGLKLEYSAKNLLKTIQMKLLETHPFELVLKEFQKYNRKKIVLDENYQIQKIKIIK